MNEEQKPMPDDTGMQDLSDIFAPSWARQSSEEVTRRAARYARDDADAGEGSRSRSSERGILRSPRPARPPRSGGLAGALPPRPLRRDEPPPQREPRGQARPRTEAGVRCMRLLEGLLLMGALRLGH